MQIVNLKSGHEELTMRKIRFPEFLLFSFQLLAIGISWYFLVFLVSANTRKLPEGAAFFPGCEYVVIPSKTSVREQPAFIYKSHSNSPKPLVVSLHTWGGSFQQQDSVFNLAYKNDWNYIHPDFGGPMWNEASCCLPESIEMIAEAVDYMKRVSHFDPGKVIFIGKSGGASAVLSLYLKGDFHDAVFYAWSPVTDFVAWRNEVIQDSTLRSKYLAKINLGSGTGSEVEFNEHQAKLKSPFYQQLNLKSIEMESDLFIYCGIFDGTGGWSTSIDQPILFYNKILSDVGAKDSSLFIDKNEMAMLHSAQRGEIKIPPLFESISTRSVFARRDFKNIHFILFDGGHEIIFSEVSNQFNSIFPNE